LGDQSFSLTKTQAKVVAVLYSAYRAGHPDLTWDQIKVQIGSYATRITDVFKRSKAWGTLIVSTGAKGTYRLNL
jgi:hypothetical protein